MTLAFAITSPTFDWNESHVEGAIFDDVYLQRLRRGDDATARHLDLYFRHRVRAKISGKFKPRRVMAAAIQSIMRGKPRHAACLPAYICGICSNLTRVAMRPATLVEVKPFDLDRIPDRSQTALQRLQEREQAEAVRRTLSTLLRRDREVLVDLFYHELSRPEICLRRGVTRAQLRLILFNALKRFRSNKTEPVKETTCDRYSFSS